MCEAYVVSNDLLYAKLIDDPFSFETNVKESQTPIIVVHEIEAETHPLNIVLFVVHRESRPSS